MKGGAKSRGGGRGNQSRPLKPETNRPSEVQRGKGRATQGGREGGRGQTVGKRRGGGEERQEVNSQWAEVMRGETGETESSGRNEEER